MNPLDIKTQKGSAGFRYDYRLNDDFSFYSLTDYNYDGKNDSGVNSLLTGLGVSTTLIQNKTTEFTLSIGPSVQWTMAGTNVGKTFTVEIHTQGLHLQPIYPGNQLSDLS